MQDFIVFVFVFICQLKLNEKAVLTDNFIFFFKPISQYLASQG